MDNMSEGQRVCWAMYMKIKAILEKRMKCGCISIPKQIYPATGEYRVPLYDIITISMTTYSWVKLWVKYVFFTDISFVCGRNI